MINVSTNYLTAYACVKQWTMIKPCKK